MVKAFYAEEIGVGHALLLAKLQLAQQEQALANCFREEWNEPVQRQNASCSLCGTYNSGLSITFSCS